MIVSFVAGAATFAPISKAMLTFRLVSSGCEFAASGGSGILSQDLTLCAGHQYNLLYVTLKCPFSFRRHTSHYTRLTLDELPGRTLPAGETDLGTRAQPNMGPSLPSCSMTK